MKLLHNFHLKKYPGGQIEVSIRLEWVGVVPSYGPLFAHYGFMIAKRAIEIAPLLRPTGLGAASARSAAQ